MVDVATGLAAISFYSLIQEIRGFNSTITTTTNETYPKIVITICLAVFAVIMAVIIAKIANVCHDRAEIEDDSSDISDNTRSIIKARLALILLQRKAREGSLGQRFFKLWSRRAHDPSTRESSASSASTVINVEEAKPTETKSKHSVGKLSALFSNKIGNIPEEPEKKTTSLSSNSNTKTNVPPIKLENKNSPSPNKTPTPPASSRKLDNFVGPNVSRSSSSSNSSPPGKRRDITSATAVSINMNGKSKKSVTFEDQVKNNTQKAYETSISNKSNLKKT